MQKEKKRILNRHNVSLLVGAILFVTLAVGVYSYLSRFSQSDLKVELIKWQSAYILDEDGGRQSCELDQYGDLIDGKIGVTYVFSSILPKADEENSHLYFLSSNCEIQIFLDGQELYSGKNNVFENVWDYGRTYVALPPDYEGRTLTLQYRVLGGDEGSVYSPFLSLISDEQHTIDNYCYANYYGMRIGAYAIIFILVCGIILIGMMMSRANYSLIFLALSILILMIIKLNVGFGYYFLPQKFVQVMEIPIIQYLPILLAVIHLILNFKKGYVRRFLWLSAAAAVILLVVFVISYLGEGYIAQFMPSMMREILDGYYSNVLYWATAYMIFVEVILSIYDMIYKIVCEQTQRQTLAMKNELIWDSYHLLERNAREVGALRHEMKHQISVMNLLYQEGDFEKLGNYLHELVDSESELMQLQFTKHFLLNVILQNYAARAKEQNIQFETRIFVPEQIGIADNDLSSLLMNLLDNAMEASAKVASPAERYILLKIEQKGEYLGIYCENKYQTKVRENEDAKLLTNKTEKLYHGYGIRHMETIAEKYGSILDISYTDSVFYVQTALRMI